jgi:hypothetical protein
MPKLFHKDATGCSFGGKEYRRAKDGSFDVPAEAVAGLLDHGFTTAPPKREEPEPLQKDE